MSTPVDGFPVAKATAVTLMMARITNTAAVKRFTIQNPFLPRMGICLPVFAASESRRVNVAAQGPPPNQSSIVCCSSASKARRRRSQARFIMNGQLAFVAYVRARSAKIFAS